MFNFLKNWFKKEEYKRPLNTGVVDAPVRDSDFVVGSTSPIVYEERLSSGNWLLYVFSKIKQWCFKNGKYHDNLGCTGNALAPSIEGQLNKINGKQKLISRRWINKMSGCNQGQYKGIGNTIVAPMDWVRKNGFVWEEDYPTPETWTVDEYYAPIPEPLYSELLKKALVNKEKYIIEDKSYERLNPTDPEIDKHLKHAPLLATIPGHQTCAVFSPKDLTTYRDSYEPWDKQEKNFLHLYKFVIYDKGLSTKNFGFNNSAELWVAFPMDTIERYNKIKAGDLSSLSDYRISQDVITLNIKKPV